jgi:hypothetical protein
MASQSLQFASAWHKLSYVHQEHIALAVQQPVAAQQRLALTDAPFPACLADYEVQANKSKLAAVIQQQRNLGRVPTMITGVYSPMGGQPYFTGGCHPSMHAFCYPPASLQSTFVSQAAGSDHVVRVLCLCLMVDNF